MKRLFTLAYQHAVIAVALIALTVTPACTTAQKLAVVTDIQKFLPAVTNVADAVCAFSPAAPVCTGAVAAVTASAGILSTALKNYYTAQASGAVPPGIVAALQQAITTFEGDAGNILDAVKILNPALQLEIEAVASAASVLLAVIETLLPAPVAAAAIRFRASAPPANTFNLSTWTVDYNAKLATLQKAVPRTVTLKKVHVHSAVVRYASLGIAK
jgi:hypothetical protein